MACNYDAAILATVPYAFYRCEEASGYPQDASGNGRHMVAGPLGSATYQLAGPFAGSHGIKFASDGVNPDCACSFTVAEGIGDVCIALSAWVYIDVLADGAGSTYTRFMESFGCNVGLLAASSHVRAADVTNQDGSVAVGSAAWHNIFVHRQLGTGRWKIYVDGSPETLGTSTLGTPYNEEAIGSFGFGGLSASTLRLSRVAWWRERCFGDQEVKDLYDCAGQTQTINQLPYLLVGP